MPQNKNAEIPGALSAFDALPDSAYVKLPVVRGLYGCSRATVYRWIDEGRIPAPAKIGHTVIWNVGELRKSLRELSERK
ncbi:helix-turn-helix transcriptional regulator [Burkholderia gladioli]|uniref:helix-turn-helix transcriptional regulator n=1 Tax=Burkholderia gladioli TaxID=28095 RepID=UPI00163F3FC2|nr:helix-turn-helix domain-containing protein [Burkholderia gladioli]